MPERWYKRAIVYCLDVGNFRDSDGDGVGDLAGLTSRLDYLARLGVTCLWVNPVHPTPNRDDGCDVAGSGWATTRPSSSTSAVAASSTRASPRSWRCTTTLQPGRSWPSPIWPTRAAPLISGPRSPSAGGGPLEVFSNRGYEPVADDLSGIELDGYGYRWFRLSRSPF